MCPSRDEDPIRLDADRWESGERPRIRVTASDWRATVQETARGEQKGTGQAFLVPHAEP